MLHVMHIPVIGPVLGYFYFYFDVYCKNKHNHLTYQTDDQ